MCHPYEGLLVLIHLILICRSAAQDFELLQQQHRSDSWVTIDGIGQEIKLVITFVYLLLGMAIVAMCHYLLKVALIPSTYLDKSFRQTARNEIS